jgi:hypothetical protein
MNLRTIPSAVSPYLRCTGRHNGPTPSTTSSDDLMSTLPSGQGTPCFTRGRRAQFWEKPHLRDTIAHRQMALSAQANPSPSGYGEPRRNSINAAAALADNGRRMPKQDQSPSERRVRPTAVATFAALLLFIPFSVWFAIEFVEVSTGTTRGFPPGFEAVWIATCAYSIGALGLANPNLCVEGVRSAPFRASTPARASGAAAGSRAGGVAG